jgi:2-keto-4-pentenoate hydratase/2-oxohepta-3-ene-1,7-dioic acid hydratase in catechol pathway
MPSVPAVFGFFASSLSGPVAEVELPDGDVDWEVKLVVAIGKRAHKIGKDSAWSHVAGVTVGQDISDRRLQMVGPKPQAGLAKSNPGFTPMGPCLVTVDEIGDPDDLELSCSIDGELVQHGRTSDLIFSVPELIVYLASVLPLEPGDVIFTGTPAGVGFGRTPPRYLRPGQTLTSSIQGIGELSQTFVAARD